MREPTQSRSVVILWRVWCCVCLYRVIVDDLNAQCRVSIFRLFVNNKLSGFGATLRRGRRQIDRGKNSCFILRERNLQKTNVTFHVGGLGHVLLFLSQISVSFVTGTFTSASGPSTVSLISGFEVATSVASPNRFWLSLRRHAQGLVDRIISDDWIVISWCWRTARRVAASHPFDEKRCRIIFKFNTERTRVKVILLQKNARETIFNQYFDLVINCL